LSRLAAHHDDQRAHGRVVLFTSGQHLVPMPEELPCGISKGAVHQITRSLADRGITVNAINPGPVDTGWPSEQLRERLREGFPAGRWGRPEDIAAIVLLLISPAGILFVLQGADLQQAFRGLPERPRSGAGVRPGMRYFDRQEKACARPNRAGIAPGMGKRRLTKYDPCHSATIRRSELISSRTSGTATRS
jgi:hypothetical protein